MGDSRSHPNGFTLSLYLCHLAEWFWLGCLSALAAKYEIETLFSLFTLIKGGLCVWLLDINACIPDDEKL